MPVGAPEGTMTRQPVPWTNVCHCCASAASTRAIACGAAARQTSAVRLIAAKARTNFPHQFFDVIGFLYGAHGHHEPVVLFEFFPELLRKFDQLGGVLEILFVLGLEDFVLLGFAVGKAALLFA